MMLLQPTKEGAGRRSDQGGGAGRRGRPGRRRRGEEEVPQPRVGGGRWWVGAQAGFAARVRAAEGGEGHGRPRVWPGLVIPCRELGNTTHPKEGGDLYYILPYGLEYK